MSSINGDKARFHRERKQKIARRLRTRELVNTPAKQRKAPESSHPTKPQTASA